MSTLDTNASASIPFWGTIYEIPTLKHSITALIVTYNRRDLLRKALAAHAAQTLQPTRLLIVDNASTDGTREMLAAEGWLDRSDIELLSLPKNIGGAGGFHAGMQAAIDRGVDWLWLMDDDGYPEQECLKKLHEFALAHNLDAISPIQVDIADNTLPAFPINSPSGEAILEIPFKPTDGNFFSEGEANLFNGVLISTASLKKTGLPRPELFIRGDEVEFTRRMRKQGLKFGTLLNSHFYHPSDRNERHKIFFGLVNARDAGNDFKNYYMFRNKGLAFRENGWLWMLPFDAARYAYYFLIHKRGDMHGLKLWARAMRDGLAGRLGRHPDF